MNMNIMALNRSTSLSSTDKNLKLSTIIPTKEYLNESNAVAKYVIDVMKEVHKTTKIIRPENIDLVPKFRHQEIEIGDLLGSGSFSDVYKVDHITVDTSRRSIVREKEEALRKKLAEEANENTITEEPEYDYRQQSSRRYVAKYCVERKTGEARYAVKCLSMKDADNNNPILLTASADLALEIEYLTSLNHPNIIKIRGMCDGGYETAFGSRGFFFLVDRVSSFHSRIKQWRKEEILATANKKSKKGLVIARLEAALGLASALNYLHELNLVYRDLRPENVGFERTHRKNISPTIKLFDFGCVREIPQGKKLTDDTHKIYGTDAKLYMSPETALFKPYSKSVDVYAYSYILWSLLSVEVAFGDYSPKKYFEDVVLRSVRPVIRSISWPESLCSLLKNSWSATESSRPKFSSIINVLEGTINDLKKS